jgi:pectate lyase
MITGGTGASESCTYTVTNAAGLKTALASSVSDSGPSIIKVNGEVTFADWCTANGWTSVPPTSTSTTYRYINISGSMSDLTILGVGTAGSFNGVGFKVSGTNIIIRNITVHEVLGQDGIQINNGTYVKVDHCTLYNYTTALESNPTDATKDTYDELISAKNNAKYIVVAWNHLHGSYKTILVGSNDEEDAKPDRKMIIHHNYFENCASRLPLYRGGFGHVYNNYYLNCNTGSGINCRTGSKLKIEKNYFQNCKNAIGFWYDTTYPTGYWHLNDNRYSGCTGDLPTSSTCTVTFESGYIYTMDDVASVPSLVSAGAGVGKI